MKTPLLYRFIPALTLLVVCLYSVPSFACCDEAYHPWQNRLFIAMTLGLSLALAVIARILPKRFSWIMMLPSMGWLGCIAYQSIVLDSFDRGYITSNIILFLHIGCMVIAATLPTLSVSLVLFEKNRNNLTTQS